MARDAALRLSAVSKWLLQKGKGPQQGLVVVAKIPGDTLLAAATRVLAPKTDALLGEAALLADGEELLWRWYDFATDDFCPTLDACCAPSTRRGVEEQDVVTDGARLEGLLQRRGLELRTVDALLVVINCCMERRRKYGKVLRCKKQTPQQRLTALLAFAATAWRAALGGLDQHSQSARCLNKSATAAIGLDIATQDYVLDCAPEVQARRACLDVAQQLTAPLLYNASYKYTLCQLLRAYPALLATEAVAVLEACPQLDAHELRKSHLLLVGALFDTFAPEAQRRAVALVAGKLSAGDWAREVGAARKNRDDQRFLARMLSIMARSGNAEAARATHRLFAEADDAVLLTLLRDGEGGALHLLLSFMGDACDEDPPQETSQVRGQMLAWMVSLLACPSGRLAMGIDPAGSMDGRLQAAPPCGPRELLGARLQEAAMLRLSCVDPLADTVLQLFEAKSAAQCFRSQWTEFQQNQGLRASLEGAFGAQEQLLLGASSRRPAPPPRQLARLQASIDLLVEAEQSCGETTRLFCGQDALRCDGTFDAGTRHAELRTEGPVVQHFRTHIPEDFSGARDYQVAAAVLQAADAMMTAGSLALPWRPNAQALVFRPAASQQLGVWEQEQHFEARQHWEQLGGGEQHWEQQLETPQHWEQQLEARQHWQQQLETQQRWQQLETQQQWEPLEAPEEQHYWEPLLSQPQLMQMMLTGAIEAAPAELRQTQPNVADTPFSLPATGANTPEPWGRVVVYTAGTPFAHNIAAPMSPLAIGANTPELFWEHALPTGEEIATALRRAADW